MEDINWKNGKVLNQNFHDYLVFTSMDMPDVKSFLIEPKDAAGPFGAKGVGEPALVPTAPAVHNALFAAIGASIPTLPFTPEKILRALNGGNGGLRKSGGERPLRIGEIPAAGLFVRAGEEEVVTGPAPGTRGRAR